MRRFGNPYLRIGNLKTFADGALGSKTAWMDEPFTSPAKAGWRAPTSSTSSIYSDIRRADKAGLQVSIHAIGDRANHTILDLYERVESENGAADRRPRIEHVQHLRPSGL